MEVSASPSSMFCIISIWRERDSPMPVPDDLVVKNGMKISLATSAGMGAPLLLNSRIGWLFWLMRTSMSVAWASMAFLVRLMNTWRSMLRSASSVAS